MIKLDGTPFEEDSSDFDLEDEEEFAQWLEEIAVSSVMAKMLCKWRDETLEIREKIENNELPSDYFESDDPPFDPRQDDYNGQRDCPYGACEERGERTGWIEIEEYDYGIEEQVTRYQFCECHPHEQ